MEEGTKVSEKEAMEIEVQTRGQAGSRRWKSEREWRLTASKFGEIIKVTDRRDMEKFCESLYNQPDLSRVPAVRHGCTYESVALKKFTEITEKKLVKSGLCIHPDFPFLGASPDSFVAEEDALVEVKCPYKARQCKITPGEDFDFLERNGDQIQLKRSHNYYYQVVGQLKLSQRNHCYFVVYTFKDFFYEKIALDNAFFMNEMLPKLKDFYETKYCPYIASKM